MLFDAPLKPGANTPSRVSADSGHAALLRAAEVIVWDEASNTSKHLFDYADRVLQDLTGNKGVPFGGKVVVLGGDWRQTLPIVPFGDRAETLAATLQQHYTWRQGLFRTFSLTQNMRAATCGCDPDTTHRDWLLTLGDGRLPTHAFGDAECVKLPAALCMKEHTTVADLVDWGRGVQSPASIVLYKIRLTAHLLSTTYC